MAVSSTQKGEWKGKTAGGCQNEKKTWHKNPFFSLVIPKKEGVEMSIVLMQKKNAMEEILPYQTLPYDFYIGYYLYDADVETCIGQVPKWKNAVEGIVPVASALTIQLTATCGWLHVS